MIVRDEAERLAACLTSVQGFVDEQVVVDTGSRDATAAIARQHGATVHTIPWPGDFAPARNLALGWVNGDWGAGARCRRAASAGGLGAVATVDGPA